MTTAPIDLVNQPPHYKSASGLECIDVAAFLPFCEGNAFKYLFRRNAKGSAIEDVRKSRWYVARAIGGVECGEWWPRDETDVLVTNSEILGRAMDIAKSQGEEVVVRDAMLSIVGSQMSAVTRREAHFKLKLALSCIDAEIDRLESEGAK